MRVDTFIARANPGWGWWDVSVTETYGAAGVAARRRAPRAVLRPLGDDWVDEIEALARLARYRKRWDLKTLEEEEITR